MFMTSTCSMNCRHCYAMSWFYDTSGRCNYYSGTNELGKPRCGIFENVVAHIPTNCKWICRVNMAIMYLTGGVLMVSRDRFYMTISQIYICIDDTPSNVFNKSILRAVRKMLSRLPPFIQLNLLTFAAHSNVSDQHTNYIHGLDDIHWRYIEIKAEPALEHNFRNVYSNYAIYLYMFAKTMCPSILQLNENQNIWWA